MGRNSHIRSGRYPNHKELTGNVCSKEHIHAPAQITASESIEIREMRQESWEAANHDFHT